MKVCGLAKMFDSSG